MRSWPLALAALFYLSCAAAADPLPYRLERDVAYGAGDRQVGDLYRPEGQGPWPAVLVIHGGSWSRGDRSRMDKFAERFAGEGYVVLNIDYRLAPEHPHPAQIEDVRAAYGWLRARAGGLEIDPERIAAMGYSAGGHLALLLALQDGNGPRPAAVASGAAPTDLLAYPRSPVVRSFLGASPERREHWVSASPLEHASEGDPPVLLYHGLVDSVVDIEHARRLHARLEQNEVPVRLIEQRFVGHMTGYVFDGPAMRDVLGFFDEHLR